MNGFYSTNQKDAEKDLGKFEIIIIIIIMRNSDQASMKEDGDKW